MYIGLGGILILILILWLLRQGGDPARHRAHPAAPALPGGARLRLN